MGTHFRGNPAELRALNGFIKLKRANSAISSRLSAVMAGYGVTESQFGILEALFHLGAMCQKRLSEKLLSSTGNITMVVDNLEKRGLVRRDRDGTDRRKVLVSLTDEGSSLIEEIFPGHVEAIRASMEVLSAGELELLSALCKKLGLGQPV